MALIDPRFRIRPIGQPPTTPGRENPNVPDPGLGGSWYPAPPGGSGTPPPPTTPGGGEPPPPPPPPKPVVDTSGWDTDGYAKPGYTATNFGQYAPSGWDQAKWINPLHQTPKYVWARIYQSNPNTPEGRQAMLDQLVQAYPGTTFVGNDKANIPGVGLIDLFRAADIGTFGVSWDPLDQYRQDDPTGTGMTDYWSQTGQPGGYGSSFSDIYASLAQGPGAYTPYNMADVRSRITSSLDANENVPFTPDFPGEFTGGARSAEQEAFANQVRQVLTQLMSRSLSPSATDPEIALPASAYRNQQQRSEERQRAELAETAGFEGWSDSGAFDTELRGIQQARGMNTAAYEAGLWADAAERRLTELTQAATLGSQFLTQQDQLQLEREITELERGIEQARLAQNESQFGRTFGENRRQFNVDQLSRLALEEAGLAQNESQFGRTFAENARQFGIDAAMRIAIEEKRLDLEYKKLIAGG